MCPACIASAALTAGGVIRRRAYRARREDISYANQSRRSSVFSRQLLKDQAVPRPKNDERLTESKEK